MQGIHVDIEKGGVISDRETKEALFGMDFRMTVSKPVSDRNGQYYDIISVYEADCSFVESFLVNLWINHSINHFLRNYISNNFVFVTVIMLHRKYLTTESRTMIPKIYYG